MQVIKYMFQPHGDERGQLVALEEFKDIPFKIKRVYYMYDTKEGVRRGFHAHKSLEQILIPKSVKLIEQGAFSGCTSLKEVVIPENVEKIEAEAFFECKNLETIIFEGETTLDEDCFTCCPRLTTISICPNTAEHYKECLGEHWHYYIVEE